MKPIVPSGSLPRRITTTIAAVVLLAFIAEGGRLLWREATTLRAERAHVRETTAIGYPGITPQISYASIPSSWIHDEGASTLIWGCWKQGFGNQWFRAEPGDVSPRLISYPLGRDVIRAIDHPIVERVGGVHWDRIPDEAFVAGHRLGGVETAYPILVLNKVFVVNDTVGDQPYLITINPFASPEDQVTVYETVVDGRRVTMGVAGYFYDRKPLLYDRGTESLWVGQAGALRAIAGKHKGRQLRPLARPVPVAWGRWRSEHPDSRLVVGAYRTQPLPEL